MDIQEFLKQTAGNWFSQKTNYSLSEEKVDNSKAEVAVEDLDLKATEISDLCNKQNITLTEDSIAFRIGWDNSPDWGKPKQKGSAIVLFVPDSENKQQGTFIRNGSGTDRSVALGRYILGSDLALTLYITKDNIYTEERQWFAGENLRLRTSLTKNGSRIAQTTFYSDIRRLGVK